MNLYDFSTIEEDGTINLFVLIQTRMNGVGQNAMIKLRLQEQRMQHLELAIKYLFTEEDMDKPEWMISIILIWTL